MDKCTKEVDLATLKAEHKTIFKKVEGLEKIYNTIYQLSSNVAILAEQMKDTKEDIEYIKEEVNTIKNKDIDNYSKLKLTVITSIVTAIIGVMIGKFF